MNATPEPSTEFDRLRERVARLTADITEAQQVTAELLAVERMRVAERAALAALPSARLLSDSVVLDGPASRRLAVARIAVGEPVARSFQKSIGVTACVAEADDVRELWTRLRRFEDECDDVLLGKPSTVLDVPRATLTSEGAGTVRVSVGLPRPDAREYAGIVGLPRFTFSVSPQKMRNFGHFLVDCAPQIAAVASIAADATFLVPPLKRFHEATLALFGIRPEQLVLWQGEPICCERLLVFESDGRTGGGRPLSPLLEMRERILSTVPEPQLRTRRLYISRRDAPRKRQWVSNESEIEAMFRERGFEVIVMSECPLDTQVRLFREARVVAGVSGAGLADLVFASPDTDVIVLMSESHMRWYASQRGARSQWASGGRGGRGRLAALGDSPRFYAHMAAALGQRCHSFVAGDRMPLDRLSGFLDDVLRQVPTP